jgi:hypothetical protein
MAGLLSLTWVLNQSMILLIRSMINFYINESMGVLIIESVTNRTVMTVMMSLTVLWRDHKYLVRTVRSVFEHTWTLTHISIGWFWCMTRRSKSSRISCVVDAVWIDWCYKSTAAAPNVTTNKIRDAIHSAWNTIEPIFRIANQPY